MYPTFKPNNAIITAIQFDGGLKTAGDILAMLSAISADVTKVYFVWKPDPTDVIQGFRIATKVTGMPIFVMPLDWVCVLPGGLTTVLSPHVFAATFEAFNEPEGDGVTGE